MPVNVAEAVEATYRSDWGRIVAALIGLVGDFDLAEESAQEAFVAAADQWRVSGVPEFPRAWIIQTARHKAIDRLRRRKRFEEKLESYSAGGSLRTMEEPDYDSGEIPDETASTDLYMLPPCTRAGGASGADPPYAVRSGDG